MAMIVGMLRRDGSRLSTGIATCRSFRSRAPSWFVLHVVIYLSIYVCVYIYICMCVCVCVSIYIYTYIYIYIIAVEALGAVPRLDAWRARERQQRDSRETAERESETERVCVWGWGWGCMGPSLASCVIQDMSPPESSRCSAMLDGC